MRTQMFVAAFAVLATYTISAIADPQPRLRVLGRYESGLFNVGGANSVDTRFGILVVDLSDPKNPEFVDYLDNRHFRDAADAPMS